MNAALADWLADTAQVLPLAAMKTVAAPVASRPFAPNWVWPWLAFGALAALLHYVFRR